MFDKLDSIDWKNLGFHIYSKQEEIPERIRDLISPVPQARQAALEFLLGGGQDFGDIYDSTPHIIPFLFEILNFPDAFDKEMLLFHLSGVAEHISNSPTASIHMLRLRLQTYEAIKTGMRVVLAILNDPSKEVRLASVDLLGYMTDEVESLIPELIRYFQAESEEEVQVTMMYCLKRLLNSLEWTRYALKNKYGPFFRAVVETHSSHKVRVAAARVSIELVADYTREQNVLSPQVPATLSKEFLELGSPLNSLEAGDNVYHMEMLAKDLSRLDPEPIMNLLQKPDISGEQAHVLTRALLASTFLQAEEIESHWKRFPNFDRSTVGRFYTHHHSVLHSLGHPFQARTRYLQAIVDADRVWEIPTNLFSFFYDLPDTRDALQALLEDKAVS